ncbi:MAG: DUF1638 domain-containing protein [Clostridiales bacterium]|nr:DUF1638 domain-containing protein [Clostridiales bacterium]
MRIHIIACRVLGRELSYLVSKSPNMIEITWQPQGLHEEPANLKSFLRASLDAVYDQLERGICRRAPDYIALGYGLCSGGIAGLEARDIPIAVPRCDDCIALFLGSQERYLELFNSRKGTYWLNNGWVETSYLLHEGIEKQLYEEYSRKYGEDNAEYLMEVNNNWKQHYKNCGFITSDVYDRPEYRRAAEAFAEKNGWTSEVYEGSSRLLKKLVDGDFFNEEFFVCPPKHRIELTGGRDMLRAVPV